MSGIFIIYFREIYSYVKTNIENLIFFYKIIEKERISLNNLK